MLGYLISWLSTKMFFCKNEKKKKSMTVGVAVIQRILIIKIEEKYEVH